MLAFVLWQCPISLYLRSRRPSLCNVRRRASAGRSAVGAAYTTPGHDGATAPGLGVGNTLCGDRSPELLFTCACLLYHNASNELAVQHGSLEVVAAVQQQATVLPSPGQLQHHYHHGNCEGTEDRGLGRCRRSFSGCGTLSCCWRSFYFAHRWPSGGPTLRDNTRSHSQAPSKQPRSISPPRSRQRRHSSRKQRLPHNRAQRHCATCSGCEP